MRTQFFLVDVDTQVDFMEPTGALYVPGAELLTGHLETLIAFAAAHDAAHLATLDTHTPDDPEFAAYHFPPHCVEGTPGWAKIPATQPVDPVRVHARECIGTSREKMFPKHTFDIFSNRHFEAALAGYRNHVALVCGVATEFCVKAAVLGLRKAGIPVILATDAIAPVSFEAGEAALAEMEAAGARLMTTAEAIAFLSGEVAHVA